MVSETRVAIREDRDVAIYELETRFATAVKQRELLERYIRERLQPNKHYYLVGDEYDDQGRKRKPSLTKEGAELICLPHVLKGHYYWISGPDNPPSDDTPYQITMKCELEAIGKFAGDGIGSASSMVTKKDGTRVQRQKDPGLRHNATIKMACKSAYIAATLNSTAASEFFSQDLEDDQSGERKKTEQKDHWCSEHKTAFFKKGKMTSYAHPIEGTDPIQWCHEHKDTKPPVKPKQEKSESEYPESEPITDEKEQTEAEAIVDKPQRDPTTIKTKNDMTKACHEDFGMSQADWIKDAGHSSFEDIAEKLSDIYIKIREVRETR